MKRFTVIEKWEDKWFRKLPPHLKCLWSWLCDKCDPAGIIEPDWEQASFQIGAEVSEKDLANFERQVVKLDDRRYFIRKFILIQYPKLSRNCRFHDAVFSAIDRDNLTRFIEPMEVSHNGGNTKPAVPKTPTPRPQAAAPAPAPAPAKPVDVDPKRLAKLRKLCCDRFKRAPEERWEYIEETALVEVAKRPTCTWEFRAICRMIDETIDPKFMTREMKNLGDFLGGWRKLLDQAASSGYEAKEDFGQPDSERIEICGFKFTRTDGGPRREQFNNPKWETAEKQDRAFRASRTAYDQWVKETSPQPQPAAA